MEKRKIDIYEQVLRELEEFYTEIPNRRHFRQAVESKLTPEDCQIWLLFPKHTETPASLDEIREKNDGKVKNIDDIFEKLERVFFISDWDEQDGVKRYVRNYIFKIIITYAEIPGLEDDIMTVAGQDWFNAMQLGGTKNLPYLESEFRVLPHEGALNGAESGAIALDMEIPDTREVVPYDFVTEMIRQRRTICLTTCNCRVNKDAMGTRECDYPIETCLLFDDLAERTLKVGAGRKISVEEALELTKRGRDMGLVHNISNAKNPSVLCQCCPCCCLILSSMFRDEATCGKVSRYVARRDTSKCVGCGKCVEVCPAKAVKREGNAVIYNPDRCIGCGLCAANCETGTISLRLREDAEKYMPDVDHFDVLYL